MQLNELHPSFNNQTKLSYYIHKARRCKHIYNSNILGDYNFNQFFDIFFLKILGIIIIFIGIVNEILRQFNMKKENPYIRNFRKCYLFY